MRIIAVFLKIPYIKLERGVIFFEGIRGGPPHKENNPERVIEGMP